MTTTSCGLNETEVVSAAVEEDPLPGIANFYQISYMYVGTVGFITTEIQGDEKFPTVEQKVWLSILIPSEWHDEIKFPMIGIVSSGVSLHE